MDGAFFVLIGLLALAGTLAIGVYFEWRRLPAPGPASVFEGRTGRPTNVDERCDPPLRPLILGQAALLLLQGCAQLLRGRTRSGAPCN